MKCPICLSSRPSTPWCAIRACGHVFCESCILEHYTTRRARRSVVDCPKCRCEFSDPTALLKVFVEEGDEDDSFSSPEGLTEKEKQDAASLLAGIPSLGLESDVIELEGAVATTERLSLSLVPGGDDESKQLQSNIEQHLRALRERLLYAHRLKSLKTENERISSEYESLKVERDALVEKDRKHKRRKQQLKDEHTQQLNAKDDTIDQLRRTLQSEGEQRMKQIVAANATRDAALKQLDEVQKQARHDKAELLRSNLKLKKKFLVASQGLTSKASTRPHRQSDPDDSLEIIPAPTLGSKLEKAFRKPGQGRSVITKRKPVASIQPRDDDDDGMEIEDPSSEIQEIAALPTTAVTKKPISGRATRLTDIRFS